VPLREKSEIAEWVGRCILPHEAALRRWLRGAVASANDVDDVVQEAYCRIASLESASHIHNPQAYLFQVARNVLVEQVRRSRIVRIDLIAELDALNIADDRPSPEESTLARRELGRLKALIDALPEKCRRVFVLRKIDGISQREIATRLGITENTVEAHAANGLRLILKKWAEGPEYVSLEQRKLDDRRRKKRN
jgi:RNA polymerase sigma-70 factor (ECF subfamily)